MIRKRLAWPTKPRAGVSSLQSIGGRRGMNSLSSAVDRSSSQVHWRRSPALPRNLVARISQASSHAHPRDPDGDCCHSGLDDGHVGWPGLVAQRQVALVLLGGVQTENGVQSVENAAQLDDVDLVGPGGGNVIEHLA